MFVQTSVTPDFTFKMQDTNGNNINCEASFEQGMMTQTFDNQIRIGQIIECNPNYYWAMREHDGDIQIFQNGWARPCTEMLQAYSDFVAERELLEREDGNK